MQEIGNKSQLTQARLVFRISEEALSFSVIDNTEDCKVAFEPYIIKSGISLAANLREAFTESNLLLRGYQRAQVMIDTPFMLVPLDEFVEDDISIMYRHAFTNCDDADVLHAILPDLNAVAVFAINKDLKMVITDHFNDVRFYPILQPVWSYLHKSSYVGAHQKLYAYFHDKKVDVFCFKQNRFKFCNTFHIPHANDAIYFLLYTWKLLALKAEKDELYVVGDVPKREWLTQALKRYVQKVYYINPTAEFNREPITYIKGLPFDLITLYLK